MDNGEEESLKFNNERKIRKQMRKRGWTEQELREALATPPEPWVGKNGSARRYRHPVTQKVVLVDEATGEIFHVGDTGFQYDK